MVILGSYLCARESEELEVQKKALSGRQSDRQTQPPGADPARDQERLDTRRQYELQQNQSSREGEGEREKAGRCAERLL